MIIYEADKANKTTHGATTSLARRRRLPKPRLQFSLPRLGRRPQFGVAALVVVVVAAYSGWHLFHHGRSVASDANGARQTISAPQSYLTSDDRSQGKPIDVSLVAPTSWHMKSDDGAQSKLLNANDELISHFAFKPDAPGGSADGDMVLETIDGWLGTAEKAGGYGGLTTQAQKLAYANFLARLRQAGTVGPSDASSLISISGQVGGAQNLTYVHTADGKLSGIIFETVISLNGGYQPVILADLSGMVQEQPVYLRGVVAYQDQSFNGLYGNGTTPTAQQVQAAIAAFAGGQVDSGMVALANHWRDSLETMKIDTSGRQAGGSSEQLTP